MLTKIATHHLPRTQDLSNITSVLVFCLAGIGDTLLATPALRALRDGFPHVKITALTMLAGARTILAQCPYIDEVLHFDFQGQGVLPSLKFVFGLRRHRFDASILAYPSNRFEYNVISFLVGARIRIGHRYNHLDVLCGNWLNSVHVKEDDELSNIEENIRLVEFLTGEECPDATVAFDLADDSKKYATQWLAKHDCGNRTLVGFHPGCDTRKNHVKRRWPREHFVALGRILSKEAGARILVFGGSEEDELKRHIVSGIDSDAVSVGTTTLLETCALIAACKHFVSNDSGLMHLAGALGVPTTSIFGPTSPTWLRNPSAPRDELTLGLPCQPCFYYSPRHLRCRYKDYRCLWRLSPSQVASSVLTRLAGCAQ